MKNGVGYIIFSGGKTYFLFRRDRASRPLLLSSAFEPVESALDAVLDQAREQGVVPTRAVVVLDGERCILRNFRLPVHGRRQLEQMVRFELEDDLPTNGDALASDFLRGRSSGGASDVVVASVPKELLAETIALFDAREIKVERIDVDAAAFARACLKIARGYDRCVGLEVGAERTLFCSLEDGGVQGLSVIPWGEASLVREVAEGVGVSEEEANRLLVLRESGEAGDLRRTEINRCLEAYARRLMREIYRLLGESDWPSRFLLSGEIVRVQGFREVFEEISQGRLEIWDELALTLGEEVDEGQRGSGLATPLGAVEEGPFAFDFRKGEFATGGGLGGPGRDLWYVAALCLAILLGWGASSYGDLVAREREVARLEQATLEVYRKAMPDVADGLAAVQYQSILSARVEALSGSNSGEDEKEAAVIEVLRTLSDALDRRIDVEILSFNLDERLITLQGETRSVNDVDAMRKAFVAAKKFQDVKIKNAVVDKGSGKIRFEIEVVR